MRWCWVIFLAVLGILSRAHTAYTFGPSDPNLSIVQSWETAVGINPTNRDNVVIADAWSASASANSGALFAAAVPLTYPTPQITGGCGDSSITFDGDGRAFLAFLGCSATELWQTTILQLDPLSGKTLATAFVAPTTLNASGASDEFNQDKPWIAADTRASASAAQFASSLYVTWSQMVKSCGCTRAAIAYSRNHGAAWSNALVLSSDAENPWPTHVAVGPEGNVYVAYRGTSLDPKAPGDQIIVQTSLNGGQTFTRVVAFNIASILGNDNTPPSIPGINFWTLGQRAAYLLPDPTQSGQIFLVANAPDSINPGVVYVSHSVDGGAHWSPPVAVGHGTAGSIQIFQRAAIDEAGNLIIYWYDDSGGVQDAFGSYDLDVYAAISHDAGSTWTPVFTISDKPLVSPDKPPLPAPGAQPGPEPRIGEYIGGIGAAQGVATASWKGNAGGFVDSFPILAPVITSITPDHGQSAGGTQVSVTGREFTSLGVTSGTFGGKPAATTAVPPTTTFPFVTTTVNLVAPPGAAGSSVDVVVTDFKGSTAKSPADLFTYFVADQPVLAVSGGTCAPAGIQATVYDANGNPAVNQALIFSASAPVFPYNSSSLTVETDVNGQSPVVIAYESRFSGQVVITVTNSSNPGRPFTSTTIIFQSGVICDVHPVFGVLKGNLQYDGPLNLAPGHFVPPNPCFECPPEVGWQEQLTGVDIAVVARLATRSEATAFARSTRLSVLGTEEASNLVAASIQLSDMQAARAAIVGPIVSLQSRSTGSPVARLAISSVSLSLTYELSHVKTGEVVRVLRLAESSDGSGPRWTDEGVLTFARRGRTLRAITSAVGTYAVFALTPVPEANPAFEEHRRENDP